MRRPVCFVVGARPNFMKAAPVYRALQEMEPSGELMLVHTGQHYDPEMSDVFLEELGLPTPHLSLGIGSGTHAEQTARALLAIENVLRDHQPELVVVSGDVNSTLAAALAAVKVEIPVAHIEAGLRSFDDSMPEEHNRRLTDHMSAVLFAHSASAVENLEREGLDPTRIHLVGNTMIDSLLAHVQAAREARPWTKMGLKPGRYGLVTLHRPALVDDPILLTQTVGALVALAREYPLVFPVHPRTRERLAASSLGHDLASVGVLLTEPLGYLEFLGLEAEARFVLTDSGGVQEETSALGVPCFTLRNATERPITVELGTNTVLGALPERIPEIVELLDQRERTTHIPLWDGNAGRRAAKIVWGFVHGGSELRTGQRELSERGARL